ncbi:WS/DGAT domain-containing protein [Zoogloea sp.]|uniref:WS/DGAT domain-containing protein n=1 Tax=Zoogloea sp. TaxID=49181 RepID=UPI0035B38560
MSTLERLGSLDMTWLQIERNTNLMQVVGVLILETPLDRAAVAECLRTRLLPMERFGQHVLRDTVGAIWESGQVDLDAHIVPVALPPGDETVALRQLVGELAATPLDPARPLWQLHLVTRYRGGSALIARVHQCIADSIALIGVLQSLTDASPVAASLPPPPAVPNFFDRLYAPLTDAMVDGIKLSGAVWAKYLSLLLNPQQVFDYARASTALALEIGKLAGLRDDSHTFLKGEPSGVKRASWSGLLPESAVLAIAEATGTSPNAVLLASLGGALHDYLQRQGATTASVELRTLMPVNLRSEGTDDVLGNRWGFMPIELPVGIADPLDRLAETHRRVNAFTDTYDAQRALGLFSLIGQTPRAVQLQALKLLATKSSAILCHVPGARQARYLAGARIVEQMFWSPPSGDLGLAISVVRYDGRYQVGLLADAAMVSDPATISDAIEGQLGLLKPKPARRRKTPA